MRTLNGGRDWLDASPKGCDAADFRDVTAFDAHTAFILSVGHGPASQIMRTQDGGEEWIVLFVNSDPDAFYNCLKFWPSPPASAAAVAQPADDP